MNTEIIVELIKTGKVYFRDLNNNIYNFKEINGFDAHCSSEIASVTLKNSRNYCSKMDVAFKELGV